MQDILIRPSMKFIKAGYALILLLIIAATALHYLYLVIVNMHLLIFFQYIMKIMQLIIKDKVIIL